MPIPIPTRIFRIIHIDSLDTCVRRGTLYAPHHAPSDGLPYRAIHDAQIQQAREVTNITCGPLGCVHDYVPFYFGPLSPMLFRLKTGQVEGYNEGQDPILYLVTTVQLVQQSGHQFVFSDGHGLAAYTQWYDSLSDLNKVDWTMVSERYWADNERDYDRQRRKQAEFLIHKSCDWNLIQGIGVLNASVKQNVIDILNRFPQNSVRTVVLKPQWYYR